MIISFTFPNLNWFNHSIFFIIRGVKPRAIWSDTCSCQKYRKIIKNCALASALIVICKFKIQVLFSPQLCFTKAAYKAYCLAVSTEAILTTSNPISHHDGKSKQIGHYTRAHVRMHTYENIHRTICWKFQRILTPLCCFLNNYRGLISKIHYLNVPFKTSLNTFEITNEFVEILYELLPNKFSQRSLKLA